MYTRCTPMKYYMFSAFLVFSVVLKCQHSSGSYYWQSDKGYAFLELKKDGSFLQQARGLDWDFEASGSWSQWADTIFLGQQQVYTIPARTKRRVIKRLADPSDTIYKRAKNFSKLLIRADTLLQLEKTVNGYEVSGKLGRDTFASSPEPDPIWVKREKKVVDLNALQDFWLIRNITGNGRDSIQMHIDIYEMRRSGDTLIVRPASITEDRFLQQDGIDRVTTSYDDNSKIELKIPIGEIERIVAKKQPLGFWIATLTTVSYLASVTSPFIALSSENQQPALVTMLVAYPLCALSWTSYYVFAKKKFRFDASRTKKKTWRFN